MSPAERAVKRKARYARQRPVDGLEAEFGPRPELVLEAAWYDQVAADRAVSGVRPVGRRLTPLETKEVARIRAEKESLVEGLTQAGIKS